MTDEGKKPEEGAFTWQAKTSLGKQVSEGKITDIDQILDSGQPIMEKEIVDKLLPGMESDLLLIGQSRGKFGGGKRRVFRQTQKKTQEGNKPHFATYAVVGNKDGYIGIGYGKAKETVPAREKAVRNAKLSIMKVLRGCGSWQCACQTSHTIPFAVEGKSGSVTIRLMPAPKGKGLCIEKECQKILAMAGIKDIWSRSEGQTRKKINTIKACMQALTKLTQTKIRQQEISKLSITSGKIPKPVEA
ncbi:MAG: 30S ribosomal protein S5 [Candidatus Woesearchaeota archaeon]